MGSAPIQRLPAVMCLVFLLVRLYRLKSIFLPYLISLHLFHCPLIRHFSLLRSFIFLFPFISPYPTFLVRLLPSTLLSPSLLIDLRLSLPPQDFYV